MNEYRNYDDENLYSNEYGVHVNAMTAEKLHGKSEIAQELAFRDITIKTQAAEIDELQGLSAQDKHIVISLKEENKAQAAEIEYLKRGNQTLENNFNMQAAEIERAEDIITRIKAWCEAYPLDIFPEPDFKEVKRALEGSGQTLDSVSASNMRHVVSGIAKIISSKGDTE
jgi:hypothetical protein